jgi:hypothetical protein
LPHLCRHTYLPASGLRRDSSPRMGGVRNDKREWRIPPTCVIQSAAPETNFFSQHGKREESCRLPYPGGDTDLLASGLQLDPSHPFGMTKGSSESLRPVSFRALPRRPTFSANMESAKNLAGCPIPAETLTCLPQGFGEIPHPAWAGFGMTKGSGEWYILKGNYILVLYYALLRQIKINRRNHQ